MKVKKPPQIFENEVLAKKISDENSRLSQYTPYFQPIDEQGRYLHWDALRHRLDKSLDAPLVWTLIKQARRSGGKKLPFQDQTAHSAMLYVTELMQKTCSQVDRFTSSAAENELMGKLEAREYFLRELAGEESISSSQLEGAATTTKVAQEMLQIRREPRNESERMILGNVRMMEFVADIASEELTTDLIKRIHETGVAGINDAGYGPGEFRTNDNVVVEDTSSGDIIHQPPAYQELEQSIATLCQWANERHEQNSAGGYLHPLLKACILHFMVGYLHPFNDGNGRTARALFYWYMLKCGYTSFRYISISKLLKEASTSYVKAYVYTETDEFDLTYFVAYQCEIVSRAVDDYVAHIKESVKIKSELDSWLWESKVAGEMNARQRQIMSVALGRPGKIFTVSEAMENLHVSYNTARGDLVKLSELGLMKTRKEGRETIFISPKNLAQAKKWSSAGNSAKSTDW